MYFAFKRDAHEAMNSFLVREALGYSAFVEALLLLFEDKKGIRQHEKSFDLPDEEPKQEQDDWWNYDGYDEPAEPGASGHATPAQADDSSPVHS